VIWTLGGSGRCAQRVAEFSLKMIATIRKWLRVQVSNPTGAIGWPSLWINYLPMRMVPRRAEMTSIEKMRRSGANSETRRHEKHATCRCYNSIEKHKKSTNERCNSQSAEESTMKLQKVVDPGNFSNRLWQHHQQFTCVEMVSLTGSSNTRR
jgi:hypothetical protein